MKENIFLQSRIPFRQRIILVLFGISLCLVLLEMGLRLGGFAILSLQEYRNRASLKQKGAYRIMCLGESTTQGGKDPYPSQLEEVLNQRNIGIKFSVINKGRGGTNTPAILSQVESYISEYHPDMVVAMMGANDAEGHTPYEKPTLSKTILFIRSFRTYKLAQFLWLYIATKAKEVGVYKLHRDKPPVQERVNIRLEEKNVQQKDNIKNENLLKKILELDPGDDKAYVGLGHLYQTQRKFQQAEECLKKALELNPRGVGVYLEIAKLYQTQRKFQQAEGCLKKALELNPRNAWAYVQLGTLYRDQGQLQQAEDTYKKALLELKPRGVASARLYGTLGVAYDEMGQFTLAEECYSKANQIRMSINNPTTVYNYHKLKEILAQKGIKLVCVQYPMLNIEPLKKIFQDDIDGVFFVDNEKTFKEAVKEDSYKMYFSDMFGGEFGHCTEKGNRLLAENVANVILKEVFHE